MTHSILSGFRDRMAWGISLVFSPFFVLIATTVVVVEKYAVTSRDTLLWLTILGIFVTVLPMLWIGILFRLSKVSDWHLHSKEERLSPLCFTLASMSVGTVILYWLDAERHIIWAGVAYIANSIVFSAITPMWKISFHSSVATGCITVLVVLVNSQCGWLFLLVPFIAWARVYRQRHTLLQTVVGAVLAVGNTALVFYVKERLYS